MDTREKEIYKVTLVGSVVNALLIVLKFLAGILGCSSAMVADAVHILFPISSPILSFSYSSGYLQSPPIRGMTMVMANMKLSPPWLSEFFSRLQA